MPEQVPVPLPFRVEFDPAKREVVVSMTYGVPPHQTMRRKVIGSLEALVIAIAEHRHEAFCRPASPRPWPRRPSPVSGPTLPV
jgi:hypothetical protein